MIGSYYIYQFIFAMGISDVFFWSWTLLVLHAFAEAIAEQPDMIVVGSTIVPDDACTQYCLRMIREGRRPGVDITNCRRIECKGDEGNIQGDGIVMVGSTQFPLDAETQKCIDQMSGSIKDPKTGAWMKECRVRESLSRLEDEEDEDLSSFFNETFFDLRESSRERVTVQNGSSVTLKCTIINRGDSVVKWVVTPKREGAFAHAIVDDGVIMIKKDKSYKLEGDYNSSFHLRIDPVRPRHAGQYGCQVYLDTVIQHSVELVVHVAASIKNIQPTGFYQPRKAPGPNLKYFYNETDRIELYCQAAGMPPPNVTWQKPDGSTIDTDTLVIERLKRQDSGTYTCKANNYAPGQVAERSAEIVVQYSPKVTVKNADIREPEGEYVTLECLVDAKPRAEYRWIKDNKTIRPDEAGINENPKSTKLIIVSLNPETDYGEYSCEATNLLGSDTGIIEVNGKPRRPTITNNPTGNRKHQFKLVWNHGENGREGDPRRIRVNSYEIRYYGWWIEKKGNTEKVQFSHGNQEPFKETVQVKKDEYRMSFVLQDLRENTTYNVSLLGKNEYGDGKIARFTFCTASVAKKYRNETKESTCAPGATRVVIVDDSIQDETEYIATTVETTTYDIEDLLPDNVDQARPVIWQARNSGPSLHGTVHLWSNLFLVVFFISVLCH